MTRLIETQKFIWGGEPKNYTGAAMTAEYVSLKLYKHLTIVIQTGAWAGGTAAVSLLEATNVSAGSATALNLEWMWTDEATGGTLVKTAVASDTFNLTTANKLYIIEIDAAELDVDSSKDCVTVVVATPGGNADFYGVVYILSEPRFSGTTPPSAIID